MIKYLIINQLTVRIKAGDRLAKANEELSIYGYVDDHL